MTGAPPPRAFHTALWFPQYSSGACGVWSLHVMLLAGARGYWGETFGLFDSTILSGPVADGDATWMSIVPMEVESQDIGIAAARGHTVVLGLGMGWCAANVALNPAVERATVIERDADVIALIEAQGVFAQLPAEVREKLKIVQADALDWRPDTPVDSVQADIWAKVVEPGKWGDVRRIQSNIGAESLYFWGQEMELYRLACRQAGELVETLSADTLARLIDQSGLPLISSSDSDYPERIVAGAPWWTPKQEGWWRPAGSD